jgi:hypothetical protein
VASRLQRLIDSATPLLEADDPGAAFFGFLALLVEEKDQGLVEALAGVGFDIATAMPDVEREFLAILGGLLTRAQRAGAVRSDVDVRDVKALLVGCQAMLRHNDNAELTRRTLAVVMDGLARA